MSILERIKRRFSIPKDEKTLIWREASAESDAYYPYCPRCEANLSLQEGYRKDLPYWICKGCGEMLINPHVKADDNVAWICDRCGAMLNIQSGFENTVGRWKCTECGFVNEISLHEIYASEAEYQADVRNPYRGLPDADALALSLYQELTLIDGRPDILLVRQMETGKLRVKKLLATFNRSIYEHLRENPVSGMPRIYELYESRNCLIVLEEYIEGRTLTEILENGAVSQEMAIYIALAICKILHSLQILPTPIIHRDIKPSNIIITPTKEVFLLDMNVAKWYDPDKKDDTSYMGTRYYAAPEQAGYGLSASSLKTDVYAVGVLINVMLTRKFPKEEAANGAIWEIIQKCIRLDAEERYSVSELIEALLHLQKEANGVS